jgi:predicted RNA-binding Zn-ribbon protein involved in translation (DUF1610 family)
MIICPSCKEEIDDNSYYCDQCGQALLYCKQCGRVGLGRRCTYCGGLMMAPEELSANGQGSISRSMSMNIMSTNSQALHRQFGEGVVHQGIPTLILENSSLNIRIQAINGAVIGRRQGPYSQYFNNNMYVSGLHAQLKYNANQGWCVVDKHSSNGTKLNQRPLQPDVEMSLKNGDVLAIANINLQVIIN